MKVELFKTDSTQVLKRALDVHQKQHEAIARNVSNVNTLGYKPVNTDFSTQLEIATGKSNIKVSDPKHITRSNFEASNQEMESDTPEKVDLSAEMTKLAENQIRYEFIARALNRYYTGIYTAITGKNS